MEYVMQFGPPLAGGMMIGLAAIALMLFNGRIAGISGILGGMMGAERSEAAWRAFFLAGLVGGGALLLLVLPTAFPVESTRSLGALGLAGLMVGFGTRLGSGCTSGHGVCGMSRMSGRSILATLVFIGTGAVTVWVVDNLMGGAV